jgi:Domain of unknown function (DUF929)
VHRVVAAALVLFVLMVSAAPANARSDGSTPISRHIVALVRNVPASTLDQVGVGELAPSGPISQGDFHVFKLHRPLVSQGKPELLDEAFAWCPHCAAESWSLAIALSRFGTLTGLRAINSGTYYCKLQSACSLSTLFCFPYTHGLSFLDASYQSPYLTFVPVVLFDVNGRTVETPTPQENAAINRFDPLGEVPALDIGGAYGFVSPGYDTGVLAHKNWSQIADSLANPHNTIARHVDGLANLITAAICKVTKGQPASVCKSRGVLAAGAQRLP